jgi:hypothetical protein
LPSVVGFLSLARGKVNGDPCCCTGEVFEDDELTELAGGVELRGGIAHHCDEEEEVEEDALTAIGATNDPPLAKYVRFALVLFAPAEDMRPIFPRSGGV